uniref:CHK kinase-like domain-containing protein n=1 Tax=Graphocephala atropunctata TaxID=36148 RepID=A0A1B6MGU2_9HEMI
MVDRRELLDFDHCKLFTEASSKLHALSMAVYKKSPELIKNLGVESPAMAEQMKKSFEVMVPNSLLCMITYLEDKPDYKKQYDILKEASESGEVWTVYKEMMDACKFKPITALIQGDPWCTNMMFRYNNSGRVSGIKIIDFQGVRLNSPIIEFVFFLTASANLEVRQTRLNDLYKIYCDSLNNNLAALGCPERFSMEELKAEITFLSPMVFWLVCSLPVTLTEVIPNMDKYLTVKFSADSVKESSFYKSVYKGSYFDKNYPQILDACDKQGVYDYMLKRIREVKSRK